MNITEKQINSFLKYYNQLKGNDLHINSEDDFLTIRTKDMDFGKIMACEKIIEIFSLIND